MLSGVYDGTCAENLNHAIIIVGYGTENDEEEGNQDYWIIKNRYVFLLPSAPTSLFCKENRRLCSIATINQLLLMLMYRLANENEMP